VDTAEVGRPAPPSADDDREVELEVVSLFPLEVTPEPLAVRFCAAIHDLPLARKAACCRSQPGGSLAGECTRTLSAALADGAVTLDAAKVAACEAAVANQLSGCDWVRPLVPASPSACGDVVRGRLSADAACRSSLECGDGLTCLGATASTRGVCSEPLATGLPCSVGLDVFAAYTRQTSSDRDHPACQGVCRSGRCQDLVTAGGACVAHAQCGVDGLCAGGRCVAGPPPPVGAACAGNLCAGDAICAAGTCQPLLPAGATCTGPFDCRGACLKAPGAATGVCGMQCGELDLVPRVR
jgi:hypothetical protein